MRLRNIALLVIAFTLVATSLFAQGNTSTLRPPQGHRMAIVIFEDLQCPDCSRAESILKDAEKQFNVPIVRHDFPLPQHNWSFDAHVMARWFDTKSPQLGEDFRHWILTNQSSITKSNLRSKADQFAKEHNVALPLFVDPTGEFAGKVKADFALGQQVGIQHTPTIYLVSDSQRTQPMVEVVDRSQMFAMIDQMKKQLEAEKPTVASKPAAKAGAKKTGAKAPAKKAAAPKAQ